MGCARVCLRACSRVQGQEQLNITSMIAKMQGQPCHPTDPPLPPAAIVFDCLPDLRGASNHAILAPRLKADIAYARIRLLVSENISQSNLLLLSPFNSDRRLPCSSKRCCTVCTPTALSGELLPRVVLASRFLCTICPGTCERTAMRRRLLFSRKALTTRTPGQCLPSQPKLPHAERSCAGPTKS